MAIDFPASPTNGQTFTSGALVYTYDGTKWTAQPAGVTGGTKIEVGNTKAEIVDTGSDGRFVVTTEGTERLRVNSSGNVGIGVTGPSDALHVQSSAGNLRVDTSTNAGTSSLLFDVPASNGLRAGHRARISCQHEGAGWDSSLVFYAGNTSTTPSEAFRVDASRRLLVGTSTTRTFLSWDTPQVQIEGTGYQGSSLSLYNNENTVNGAVLALGHSRGTSLGSNTVISNGDYFGAIPFYGSDGSNEIRGAEIAAYVDGTPGANDMPGRIVLSTTSSGASSPTERMRINNSGQTFINATTDAAGVGARLHITSNSSQTACSVRAGTDGTPAWYFANAAGTKAGDIVINTSSTAYNTSSDYRLKENVVALASAIDRVNQLQVHRFNFIADPDKTVDGFIAHEAQEVVPECVTGEKDAVDDEGNPIYQGIDQSKLVPLLTAALQEAIAEIASLKDRVSALEAQ